MCNYKKDLKKKEERIGGLVNLIMDYAIEHEMSIKEIDESVDIAKEIFYSDATVKRTAPEVPVQEQLTLQEANQLLLIQFKALASRNELSDTEFKNMIELYSILFPYHP